MTSSLFIPKTGLREHEIRSIISQCDHSQFKLAFTLMYQLGLRPSECLRIEIKHLQLQLGVIALVDPKGQLRYLPLPVALSQHLPSLFESRFLFANQSGEKYHLRSLQLETKKAAKAAGIHLRYGASSFRHAFAERMIDEGMPPSALQYWMGIQHEKSMNRYL